MTNIKTYRRVHYSILGIGWRLQMNCNNIHKLALHIYTENEAMGGIQEKHGLISETITYDTACSMRCGVRSPEEVEWLVFSTVMLIQEGNVEYP
jgi:hypothetical protein